MHSPPLISLNRGAASTLAQLRRFQLRGFGVFDLDPTARESSCSPNLEENPLSHPRPILIPMLVSRQNATEQSPWSISKFETSFHKSADSLRMSNHFDSVTQSDWQGQYAFLPPGDNNIFSQPYDHVASSADTADSQAQPRSVTAPSNPLEIEPKQEPESIGHRLDPLGLRQPKQPSPIPEQPENPGEQYATKASDSVHEESLVSTETPGISITSNPLSSVSSTGQGPEVPPNQPVNEAQPAIKDEDEDVLEDEEMVEGDGEGDAPTQPQTAAERTAQRRKMKRFR